MMKFLLTIVFLSYCNFLFAKCFQEIDSLGLKFDVQRLHLESDEQKRLYRLISNSKNKIAINQLLLKLSSSNLNNITNLLQRRSKKIVDSIEFLDRINFDSTYFFSKIVSGSKLTLQEKRSYYLLAKKKFWFSEGQLYKNRVSDFFDDLSLLRFIQKRLDRLKFTTEFDKIFIQLTNHHPTEVLFNRAYVKKSLEARFHELFENSSQIDVMKRKIIEIENETLKLISASKNRFTRDYYTFRYDQLNVMKKILLDKNFSIEDFKIRNSILFGRITTAALTVENISKILAYMTTFTFIIDQTLKHSFRLREVTPDDLEFDSAFIKNTDHVEENISVYELLEEQYNSGQITYEEFLAAISHL